MKKKKLTYRRQFMKKVLGMSAGITTLASTSLHASQEKDSTEEQPNILIIYTDQQALWTISAYKEHTYMPVDIDTPNIDRIAQEGALLKNYFTNSAVCTPSRGCFVSGLYPHNNGAYKNNKPLNVKAIGDGTWGNLLYKNKYDTAWIGKWHLDGNAKPGRVKRFLGFGQEQWRWNRGHWKGILSNNNRIKKFSKKVLKDEKYTTNWLTNRAIDFLTKKSHEKNRKPFALTISIPDPHGPLKIYEKYAKLYKNKVTLPKSIDKKYDSNRPNWANKNQSKLNIQKEKAQYLGMVKCIDDNVGRILDTLDKYEMTENTIVIFTTDHGEFMGEHGFTGKNKMYEPAFHIPFLIKWPGKIQENSTIDAFITTVDIKKTILKLANITTSSSDGRDASNIILNQDSQNWENTAYLHHASFKSTGIITEDWFMAHVKDKDSVLYSRKNDPEQIHNLASESDYADVMEILTRMLHQHHQEVKTKKVLKWLETYL